MLRAILSAVLLLSACTPQNNALWIEPGSTADHLVLGIGQYKEGPPVHQFQVLRVSKCEGPQVGSGAMWVLSLRDDVPAVQKVVYGETPPGYVSDEGPLPLVPGCYQAAATTGGLVEFHVLKDGGIREVKPRVRWESTQRSDPPIGHSETDQ